MGALLRIGIILDWFARLITYFFGEFFVKHATKYLGLSSLKALYISTLIILFTAFTGIAVSCVGVGGSCSNAITSSNIFSIEFLKFGLSLIPHECLQMILCFFNVRLAGYTYIQSRMIARIIYDTNNDAIK